MVHRSPQNDRPAANVFGFFTSSSSTTASLAEAAWGEIEVRAERPANIADQDPWELYGELFERVQLAGVFEDSKHFVDMIPKDDLVTTLRDFQVRKPELKTELLAFIERHFNPPADLTSHFESLPSEPVETHIKRLWPYLKRTPDEETQPECSLIHLPHSYIVPGGRFRELYYWDSYFTQLGLLADGEDEVFQNMVKNFAHLLMTIGRIPNGNRDYYRGRSQPPFFSYMIALWQERYGNESALQFLPALIKEHHFWMSGGRVVRLGKGVLNRYWDDRGGPRPESYREDLELAVHARKSLGRLASGVYRDLRAGAESGWDFSTRWFEDPREFATIRTSAFIPVDLNSFLYSLETKIAELALASGDELLADAYAEYASERRELIQHYLWNETSGTYHDYHWGKKARSPELTVAMVAPLFAGVATPEQASRVASRLERDFLKPGGLVTTLRVSGQQWDAPNGWAPAQWMAYAGLKRYHLEPLAEVIRQRWLTLNQQVFRTTGKLMEKYNVVDVDLMSGGGEYPLQVGFGWTNGVYRALSMPEVSLIHLKPFQAPSGPHAAVSESAHSSWPRDPV
ncbi:MAG: alpha,alpha-trehalase TreF [Methylotenera sp.]|nr:alpha,alpha-trehalase TreF [Oligoflexia bacterium]